MAVPMVLELIWEGEFERTLDGVFEQPFVYVYCVEGSPNWMSAWWVEMLRPLTPWTRAVAPIAWASKGEIVADAVAGQGCDGVCERGDGRHRQTGRSM
jgi:hypothetical protein